MKKIFIALTLPILLILSGCIFDKDEKDLSYYKKTWEDVFRNYQKSVTKIGKKGKFDFEITALVSGNKKENDFGLVNFGEKFSSLSLKIFGEYDFVQKEKPSFSSNIRLYINKRAFGVGDLDIDLKIDSDKSIFLTLYNLDKKIFKFFNIDDKSAEALMLSYEQNKGKSIKIDTYSNLISQIMETFENSSSSSPLDNNSKEEESKIIDYFLKDEVLKVNSAKELDTGGNRISLSFNSDNFVKFLNHVSKLLKQDKDFSKDAYNFKDYKLVGTFDIKDNKLLNSDFSTEFPLSSIDEKSNEKKYDLLIMKNNFKMPNPEKLNVDFTTLMYSKSKENNKLQIRLRGIIK